MKTSLCAILILCATVAAQTTQPARDDAPALQSLLASSVPVRLEHRVYRIASTIHLTGAVLDVDANGATFKAADNLPIASGAMFGFVQCSGSVRNGLTIDGNRAVRGNDPNCNANLITMLACHDMNIAGSQFKDSPADFIRIAATDPTQPATACQRVLIDRCDFNGAYRNGISVIGGAFVRVTRSTGENIIHGAEPNAFVDVEPNPGDAQAICHDNLIAGNTITNCERGLASPNTGCGTVCQTFVGNMIGGCQYGIISEASQSEVSGNVVSGCWIFIENSDRQRVFGNVLTRGGIYADTNRVVNPVGHSIAGNTAAAYQGAVTAAGNFVAQ